VCSPTVEDDGKRRIPEESGRTSSSGEPDFATAATLRCSSGDGNQHDGCSSASRIPWWSWLSSPALPCIESTTASSGAWLGRRTLKAAARREQARRGVEAAARARGRTGPRPL
jgi:hypothetical protein